MSLRSIIDTGWPFVVLGVGLLMTVAGTAVLSDRGFNALPRILTFLDQHSGGIQAVSTIVLVVVTAYYVSLTHESVRLLQQERSDRIERARLPLRNALLGQEQTLDELATLLAHGVNTPEDQGALQRLEGQIMNASSRVARAADQAASEELKTAALEVTNGVVPIRTALAPPLGTSDANLPLVTRLQRIPSEIDRVRQQIATTRVLLERYAGP